MFMTRDSTISGCRFFALRKSGRANSLSIICTEESGGRRLGAWLAVFAERGVNEIHGVDGDYVNRDKLLFDV